MNGFIRQFRQGDLLIPDNPLVVLYGHVLEIFVHAEPEPAYEQLMATLEVHGKNIPRSDEQALYQYARNHCIRKSNAGHPEYLNLLLEVYRRMIDRELIFFDGILNPGDMKNIVSLGITLKEYQWTEWFLTTHGQRIVEEHRDHALAYNQAHLKYAIGDYGAALNLLARIELEDVFYALGARTIQLKCYFEMGDSEALFDHLQAFNRWLQRNRHLADSQKKAHLRLLKVIRMIVRYRTVPLGPKAFGTLKSRIETTLSEKGLSQAGWISEQWKQIS